MELEKILPKDGPSVEEVKKYLEKYNNEFIVMKMKMNFLWCLKGRF